MGAQRLSIRSVSRRRPDQSEDTLVFKLGVNVLVGDGNAGKTKWLETIDYLFGDDVSPEERADPDNVLFSNFESASAVLQINDEELLVERRWMEPGSLGKVYVDGEGYAVKDYCHLLMDRLGIPILNYPQGNPYGTRKWPELSWRSLFRHLYRRETFWSDIADRQPAVEQHAALMQLLGVAGQLFSSDVGDLVERNKLLWALQAKRDHFMSILDQISRELVSADELGVALTPESISAAEQRLKDEEDRIAVTRNTLLSNLQSITEETLRGAEEHMPGVEETSANLMHSQNLYDELSEAIKRTSDRISEMKGLRQLLSEESQKLVRAQEASYVLADLRVTHCPACDQALEKSSDDCTCYVCKRTLPAADGSARPSKRIEFETEQVQSELEETGDLIKELELDLDQKLLRRRQLAESIAEIKALLRPFRQAAAAVLPPELFILDANYGGIQEKTRQLARIKNVLSQRESIADEIQAVKAEISNLESKVDTKTNVVDFETLADGLRDGINTYLNRIKQLNPNSWLGSEVSVRLAERSFKFKVGESGWDAKLGGTQRLYFLFAYHYALLSLTKLPNSLYPGFLMLDFPANLEDRAAIADKENFILEPFVELLRKKEMSGCQVIAAGRSFRGLKGVHVNELTEVWK